VDFKCMDLNKLQWSINITNIIFDLVVLALPIPLVWRSMCFLLNLGEKAIADIL
jgi:signal transduction histidine kinase